MTTCKIQWIDAAGVPTPDEHPIYGYVICFSAETPEAIPICAEHFDKMPREGWMFIRAQEATPEKLAAMLAEVRVVTDAIRARFSTAAKILPTLRKGSDHYSFIMAGMYVGVEPDGYIHT
jgi:hypothetical protein